MNLSRRRTMAALTAIFATSLLTTPSCTQTECASADYTRAECRVLAEGSFARAETPLGTEVRMQLPGATDASSWVATGLVRRRADSIYVRVAHPGPFAVSLTGHTQGEDVLVELDNIHPDAVVRVELDGADPVELDASAFGLRRTATISVPAGEVVFVRGELPCPSAYRLVTVSDVQTNPLQFARILEHLNEEARGAQGAGQMLAGVLMAGDLTESSREDEFRAFVDILDNSPVPMALTPGNHDIYDPILPYFNQNFGPGNVAFDVCRTHVAMLDTGSGSIAPSVLGRLPELFAKQGSDFSVSVMHHVPYPETTGQGWSDEDAGFAILGEFALQDGDLVVAGHAHLARDFGALPLPGGSPRQIVVGTAGASQGVGQPLYGYARLTFDSEIEVCFVEVPAPGQQPRTAAAIEEESGFVMCTTP